MNVINIYPTCGMACATNLRVSCGLPNSNKSQAPTSDPPNSAFVSSGVPSSLNNADITPLSSQSRPNQILGCVKFLKIPPDHFFFFKKSTFPPYFLHPQNDVHLTVAEIFTSGWQTLETLRPAIKRIYRIVVKRRVSISIGE